MLNAILTNLRLQMPIVDGLTSTKMIRSFEKSHPTQMLSTRASLNGRAPIIAVSASLVEKERQNYIDAGFDGWILKPIAFNRLSEIMKGIVDRNTRKENLYAPGRWESGGWFEEAQKDVFAADTAPNEQQPTGLEGQDVQAVADNPDPGVKEEESSVQSQEQKRMLEVQEEENRKAKSLPILESQRTKEEDDVFTEGKEVASPPPIE